MATFTVFAVAGNPVCPVMFRQNAAPLNNAPPSATVLNVYRGADGGIGYVAVVSESIATADVATYSPIHTVFDVT